MVQDQNKMQLKEWKINCQIALLTEILNPVVPVPEWEGWQVTLPMDEMLES